MKLTLFIKRIGEAMRSAREWAGLTLADVARQTGWSDSNIWSMEKGQSKNPPTPFDVIQYANAVRSHKLKLDYCMSCPMRDDIVVPKFSRLNNIDHHPGIMAMKMVEEIAQCSEALPPLVKDLCRIDFQSSPDFYENLNHVFHHFFSIVRCIDEIEAEFIERCVITTEQIQTMKAAHDQLMIAKGHHKEER